jgi:hypothetical protein
MGEGESEPCHNSFNALVLAPEAKVAIESDTSDKEAE